MISLENMTYKERVKELMVWLVFFNLEKQHPEMGHNERLPVLKILL